MSSSYARFTVLKDNESGEFYASYCRPIRRVTGSRNDTPSKTQYSAKSKDALYNVVKAGENSGYIFRRNDVWYVFSEVPEKRRNI